MTAAGSEERIWTNARVVTRDRVFDGTVVARDGAITAVDDETSAVAGAVDLDGDLLLPGLIELHTDNLEKHFLPRPGVVWPSGLAAVLAHDTQIVGAGITTVFDALAVGDYRAGGVRKQIFHQAVESIRRAATDDMCRADHLLHMRCEIADAYLLEMFEPYAREPLIRLVSIMDHTPGQRQWTDIEKFREYMTDRNWTDAQIAQEVGERIVIQKAYADKNRRRVLEICSDLNVPVASHDDTLEQHVDDAVADGMTISEFPTTRGAAQRAREAGMTIVMGAPNIVRGGSHSGNVSAIELAGAGLLDGLSSDYVPASLLHAAFQLHGQVGISLPEAVAKVSFNAARMVGLDDRGEIAVGRRADVVRVTQSGDLPIVRQVWRGGARVL